MRNKVITVAQQKGGAGKTTLVVHLAVALMQRGCRVALIDIDPQGSLGHWHRIRTERMGEGYTGLHFSTLSGWRVGSEVSRLRKNYDVILIDSPPHVETEARTAMRSADLIIVPVQPSPTDLWATKATMDYAKSERVMARIVMNRMAPQSKIAQAIMDELDGLCDAKLGNRIVFASALLEGKGVTEVDPKSQASQEIKALTEELLALFPQEVLENA
ncbi:MAG: ParA family protein [Alphaproteobacteria bacterium]|nr:MAG: ParA family protein [Alphaproteobacteria bacterium]TAE81590.1 MAG: ParA family protein [Alphaproteobacteria bacterium]TAF39142.1 MAG: ParA family protein [Alphaproteobacteria bacterium]TAF77477.1 MAG: ParA family protein [Alphaproteobacteria bacterium]